MLRLLLDGQDQHPRHSGEDLTSSLVDVEGHLVGAEGVGQGEGVDAHCLELRVGLEPVGVGGSVGCEGCQS